MKVEYAIENVSVNDFQPSDFTILLTIAKNALQQARQTEEYHKYINSTSEIFDTEQFKDLSLLKATTIIIQVLDAIKK